ncbi:Cytidylate kinase [hydrothermal vent metagenome]|uniref:(d)CMP kinase n=1 Tax=hydrothermal vent metagenome TaxID=652676 RepID=A0A3B1DML2_9ZZZZ
MIVTIDGPAGSGKSSVAKQLAKRLGFAFLDTGAMYRAVAWNCLQHNLDLTESTAIIELASTQKITFDETGKLFSDGKEITPEIRSIEVTKAASVVAMIPEVREQMVIQQRNSGTDCRMVTEGRDQGTVVFPNAPCKFFLTARLECRAKRRQQEIEREGETITLKELCIQLEERDQRDQNRKLAPMKPAADATIIDTSEMAIEEVIALLEKNVRECREFLR